MPAVIDHAGYPHIFEAILHHAPVGALIPLRATCKALKEHVDAILFAHVQLQPFPKDGKDWASGAVIGLTLPADTSLVVSSPLPRLPWVPGAVRVLDDTMTWNDDYEYAVTNDAFSSLQTIRQLYTDDYNYDHSLFDVPTAVLFVEAGQRNMSIRPNARRMVAHFRGMDGYCGWVETSSHDNVREFVFVFWPPLHSESWCIEVVVRALYTQRRAGDTIPEWIYVVGLDLPPHDGLSEEFIRESCALEYRFGVRLHQLNDECDDYREWVNHIGSRLLLWSIDDWLATLDDHQYLEGTWMQPRPVSRCIHAQADSRGRILAAYGPRLTTRTRTRSQKHESVAAVAVAPGRSAAMRCDAGQGV